MSYDYFPEIFEPKKELKLKIQKLFSINGEYEVFLKKGDILTYDGFPGKFLFLKEGKIALNLINYYGSEKLLLYIDQGNVLFNDPDKEVYYAKIRAVTDCIFLINNEDVIYQNISGDIELIQYFIESGRHRGMIFCEGYFSSISESSRCQVYKMIYRLAVIYGKKNDDNSIYIQKIPVQRELASLLDVHRTNVAKYISFLEEMNIIEKINNGIIIKDLSELNKLIIEECKNGNK